MSAIKYNKLVRDRIPEIITADGKACTTEILSDEDYLRMLDAKLDEELAEYHEDQNIEELADLLEVLRAVAVARGYTLDELERVRAEKAKKRGGFEKKILLKTVSENTDYSFLLKMQSYLQKTGNLYSTTFPELIKERSSGRHFPISDHLRALVYAQLSANTKWSRIVPHLHEIDCLFSDYDVTDVLNHDAGYYISGIKALKCGSRCTNDQMKHLHTNIQTMQAIEREYGSMDAFVTSDAPETIVRDLSAGTHKLLYVGPALAWEYLRNVGIDGVKPDIHVCRFLSAKRSGLSDSETVTTDEAVKIVRDISETLQMPMVEIDSIIWSFCASGYGEICTAEPKCDQCVIRDFCKK